MLKQACACQTAASCCAVRCSASPLELASCEDEGAIVCHHGHIKGQQGVALDDMVYVMTRMARQMEEVRIRKQTYPADLSQHSAARVAGSHTSCVASSAILVLWMSLYQSLQNHG